MDLVNWRLCQHVTFDVSANTSYFSKGYPAEAFPHINHYMRLRASSLPSDAANERDYCISFGTDPIVKGSRNTAMRKLRMPRVSDRPSQRMA